MGRGKIHVDPRGADPFRKWARDGQNQGYRRELLQEVHPGRPGLPRANFGRSRNERGSGFHPCSRICPLSSDPYVYTQEELLFLVHVRRQRIPHSVLESKYEELWDDFFSRPRACLRPSPLPIKYGWGIHFDSDGKIALVPMESEEYRCLEADKSLTQLVAMRNRRE
ncbi:MAG: DUF6157 family protein [Leptospirillum sp.]